MYSIAIAGGGFVLTALAGMFDAIWHTRFGLDETGWSFPHSMLGAGVFVAFVGIAACRWTIRDRIPIGIGSALVFGLLPVSTSAARWTAPIGDNLSPEVIKYVARIPVLAAEPAFQHTTRIYLWGQPRADGRRELDEHAPAIPHPAIVVVVLRRSRPAGRATWWLAGFGFAFVTAVIWPGTFGGVIIRTPLFVAGAWLDRLIWSVVERPTRRGVLAFVILAGIVYPAFTGVIDLSLGARIP